MWRWRMMFLFSNASIPTLKVMRKKEKKKKEEWVRFVFWILIFVKKTSCLNKKTKFRFFCESMHQKNHVFIGHLILFFYSLSTHTFTNT